LNAHVLASTALLNGPPGALHTDAWSPRVPTRPARPVRSAGPEVAPPAAPTPSPTPPGDLPPGTRLGGRYVIEGRLGHGGFASVYRARQDNLGRPVAIKVLRPHPSVPLDSQRARLQREAEALSRLSAPGCVRIYDVGELPDGRPWIAQEFVAGTRLDIALKSGPFTTARAIEVAAGVLLALAEAHAHGVVHRDIKPDNIMLVVGADGRERVKVLDFGIARLQGPTDAQSFRTSTRHVFGTPQYMAPEQARQEPLGPAADLYAVGILLHRMLVGREPFDGPDGYGILRAQVYDTVPRPAGVPAPVVDVMMQALAKRPEERFESATAMRAALRVAGLTPPTPKRRWWVAAAVVAGLTVGFALGVVAARSDRTAALEAAPTLRVYTPQPAEFKAESGE